MARDKTKNRNGPWLKRVLIPFWVAQLILMLAIFVIYIMAVVTEPWNASIYEILLIILSSICIVLDITEIILFARRNLKPLTYLLFQLVKTPIWLGLFVDILIRGWIQQARESVHIDTNETIIVAIFALLFFVFLGSLIYGSIMFHRYRRNKRRGNNITQNPYYNGPYSEIGLATASYQPLNSPYPLRSEASDGIYGDESVMTPMPAAEHFTPEHITSDTQDKKRRVSSVGSPPSELGGQERNGYMGVPAKELPAVPEVYELASSKSIKRGRNIGA